MDIYLISAVLMVGTILTIFSGFLFKFFTSPKDHTLGRRDRERQAIIKNMQERGYSFVESTEHSMYFEKTAAKDFALYTWDYNQWLLQREGKKTVE